VGFGSWDMLHCEVGLHAEMERARALVVGRLGEWWNVRVGE
jgi:hypothetical protein